MITSRAIIVATAVGLCASPAFAEDIASALDWSGFYAGGHIGGSSVKQRGDYDDVTDFAAIDFFPLGSSYGAQFGYNWQRGTFVYGLELDGTWLNASASRIDDEGDTQIIDGDFVGSVNFRTGVAIDKVLLFTSLGFAHGSADFTVIGDVPSPATRSIGSWGFAGSLGVEWAFAPAWSMIAQYTHYSFDRHEGTPTLTGDSSTDDYLALDNIDAFHLGFNYHLDANPQQFREVRLVSNVDWTGTYLGVHAGGGNSRILGTYDEVGDHGSLDINPQGFLGGVQLGQNWQIGPWVYGIEVDGSWSGMQDNRVDGDGDTQELETNALFSARGRIGVAADNSLFYFTGGIGYVDSELIVNEGATVATAGVTSLGPVIGGGIDWHVAPNWSLRIEGLTYFFFDDRQSLAGLTADSDAQDFLRQSTVSVLRVGANFHLN